MSEARITSERAILMAYLKKNEPLVTEVPILIKPTFPNPAGEDILGTYREMKRRKALTADMEVIEAFAKSSKSLPSFAEAGPRKDLAFPVPTKRHEMLRVGIVTTGGLAPGLNSVIHSIVERHMTTYHELLGQGGEVWGFLDSFKGLVAAESRHIELNPDMTERWLQEGGSELGSIRYHEMELPNLAQTVANNLERWGVKILYVIGGDGSLTAAHEIAKYAKKTIIAGIPKTMDNDILWVWQSFGFNSAVERTAAFINTMHYEAEGTRRVAVLEFFGAQSGFVAANAALASGHVDLVIIPEVFEHMNKRQSEDALASYKEYLIETIRRKQHNPHAVIVIAEGVGQILAKHKIITQDEAKTFASDFSTSLGLNNMAGEEVKTFVIQPRHYIRSIPANSHDQIYCKRLGTLAVDNALAGYTDFMISQWLTEYVLVPLQMVAGGQKRVPTGGIFWKQVVASTGQPPVAMRY